MSFSGEFPAGVPLNNLCAVQAQIESVQRFLSASLSTNTVIPRSEMEAVSSQISSAIHQVIVNGAALLACAQTPKSSTSVDLLKVEEGEGDRSEYEITELDAVELLAEHLHFCEICGKGFKRDANLRMHMRAHGFKTPEALAKPLLPPPQKAGCNRRFSCPYVGCNRNKQHKKFRALKSVVCVKNHFKRSHCPKMYSCDRCNSKRFSVLADLKCHLKHCGESSKWKCSCGTTFSRKDKLFGHLALFDGHMPAVVVDEELKVKETLNPDVDDFENYCFQDLLGSPADYGGMDGFFNI